MGHGSQGNRRRCRSGNRPADTVPNSDRTVQALFYQPGLAHPGWPEDQESGAAGVLKDLVEVLQLGLAPHQRPSRSRLFRIPVALR
jgi:hypothetical protein